MADRAETRPPELRHTRDTRSATVALALAFAGALLSGGLSGSVSAQGMGAVSPGTLPPTAPTSLSTLATRGTVAPLSAVATGADATGNLHHRAQVSCAGGQLTVRADNSSLNGILRSIAQCTGMRISGGVADQRVFGSYGPAAPATVLGTLLDGTGTNMVLEETAAAQPAVLILSPRTAGVTLPSPTAVPDDDPEDAAPVSQPVGSAGMDGNNAASGRISAPAAPAPYPRNAGSRPPANPNVTPVPQPIAGSAVTGPVPIPLPANNVNGSPNNVSPTASSYPTTDSVGLDSLPTPSTTPSTNGIVDAPNPPAPGSDTSRLLGGMNANQPGTTDIIPGPTNGTTQPGGTNTSTPVPTGSIQPGADATGNPPIPAGTLTPQQVYEQLQQIRGRQQGTAAPSTPPVPPTQPQ